ncbi:hypothetical protein UCD39_14785 [Nitrospirillum sp. BR 11752]|uniref:hypothetical protein n=1 Tax=Nitrospirillum sp. BR 11752 TaxID=3104293 RepID=UPI002EC3190E|nr:hypothetical protein [Nitrospirillum sp. BR 11752]
MKKFLFSACTILLLSFSFQSSSQDGDQAPKVLRVIYGKEDNLCNSLKATYQKFVNSHRGEDRTAYVFENLSDLYNGTEITVPVNEISNASIFIHSVDMEGYWHDNIYYIDVTGDGTKRVVYLRQDPFGRSNDRHSRIWVFKNGVKFSPDVYEFKKGSFFLNVSFNNSQVDYFSPPGRNSRLRGDKIADSENYILVEHKYGKISDRLMNNIYEDIMGEEHIISVSGKIYAVSGFVGYGDAVIYSIQPPNSIIVNCVISSK